MTCLFRVTCDALSRGERGGEKPHVGSRIRINEPFRFDVSGLFGENLEFVVSGPFIARVENGSLVDLTRVLEP